MKTAKEWDVVDYLQTDEDIVAYLNAALEEGDQELITIALGDIARAKGMTQLSRETGISRDGLYKALSAEGNPTFSTVLKVLQALGLAFNVSAAPSAATV